MSTVAEQGAQRRQAIRYPAFRWLWLGASVSRIGSYMYLAALGWVTAITTGSPVKVTLIAFSGLFPLLFLGPLAGALADRRPRRTIVVVTALAQLTVAAALSLAVSTDHAPYWALLTFAVLIGSGEAITFPALQGMIPGLVPPVALRNAMVLNSLSNNLGRALGPMLAGVLLSVASASTVFWINSASFLAVLVAAAFVPSAPVPELSVRRSVRGDTIAALKYVRGVPALAVPLLIGVVAALIIGPTQALTPIIATKLLHVAAREFGLLLGAFGTGAIMAGLLLLHYDRGIHYRHLILFGAGLAASGLLGISLVATYPVAVVCLGALGAAHMCLFNAISSTLQAHVDDRARGRVMSMWQMSYGAGAPAGILIQGVLVSWIGVRAVLAIDAVLLMVFSAVIARPSERTAVATDRAAVASADS